MASSYCCLSFRGSRAVFRSNHERTKKMAPKPANLKLPGISHADSAVLAGAIDSPRQTRSGRIIPPTPRTGRPARAEPEPYAEPSTSTGGPLPLPHPANDSAQAEPAESHGPELQLAGSNEPIGDEGSIKVEGSSTGIAAATSASSARPLPSSSDTGSTSRARNPSFSRSRLDHSLTRSEEHETTQSKGKERAIGLQTGQASAAGSSKAPGAGSSQAHISRQRDSTPIGGIQWSEIEAYLETRDGSPPPRVVCLFCQKELIIQGLQAPADGEPTKVLPCGHVFGEDCMNRWMDEQTYTDEFDGPVSAMCPICRRSASSGREVPPPASLSDLFQEPLRGRQPTRDREPPEPVLGRRRRPDASVSTSRPPQQRPRHRSPSGDHTMEGAEEQSSAQPGMRSDPRPDSQPGQRLKHIVIRDPEKVNADGQFAETPALVIGRLAMRGKMAVELPSLNPEFPMCPRRYIMKTKDHKLRSQDLFPLQNRNLQKLRAIRDQEREQAQRNWAPEIVGIISSPQYSTEPQSNPHHILKLRLPEGDEWHSKSDSFAAFGDLTFDMEEYWLRSGQKKPIKPREVRYREYLQHFGIQQGGEVALSEVDSAQAALSARLLDRTAELERERLAARQRDAGGPVGGSGGSDEG